MRETYVCTKERQRPHDAPHRLEQAGLPDELGSEEEAEDGAVEVGDWSEVHDVLLLPFVWGACCGGPGDC